MHIVILITASEKKEAQVIAGRLVSARLAACVNIVEKVDSVFFWQGKLDKAKESLLIVKSRRDKFSRIVRLVKSVHSYEVPEIIALPVIAGEKKYLRWLDESVKPDR